MLSPDGAREKRRQPIDRPETTPVRNTHSDPGPFKNSTDMVIVKEKEINVE